MTGYAEVIPISEGTITSGLRQSGSYRMVARIEMASKAPFYGMCVIVPGSPRVPAKLSRGYNRRNLCLSFQARILAPMKLPGR